MSHTPAYSEHSALLGDADSTAERGGQPKPTSSQAGGQTSKVARMKYYLPFMTWIPNYSISLLGNDFIAGLSVACILIPQSISYATSLAHLGALSGLFAASIPGVVYALLGTCRQLSVAPEASLSLLIGQSIQDVFHSDPHDLPENPNAVKSAIATITMLQAGVFMFLLGLLRLGFIDVLLSRALLTGFITAMGLIISIEQLIPMLGLVGLEDKLHPHTTFQKFLFLVENATQEHRPTTLISFIALASLVLFRFGKIRFSRNRILKKTPELLLVVMVSTALCQRFRWNELGVDILGAVPIKTEARTFVRLPIHKMTLRYMTQTTPQAVLIAIIGYLDSIVAGKQNSIRFGYSISPNRELVALGAGNIIGSFVPGLLPAAGSLTRSRINADNGARTQMSSLICSALVLFATFFLLPSLYFLPRCVLASIVFMVVFTIVAEAPHEVAYFLRMKSWSDLGLMGITFITTLLFSIEVGIVTSIICSLLLLVHKSSRPRLTILGRIPGTSRWKPVNEVPEAEEDVPGALIVRLRDNLNFANTAQLKDRLRRLELYGLDPSHPADVPRREQASVIVFHLADLEDCDASAAQIFYELVDSYKSRGTAIFLAHVRPSVRQTFERAGIARLLGEDSFYEDVAAAMERVEMVELAATHNNE